MSSRTTNTMSEGLAKLLQSLGEMKAMPDADLPWIIDIETAIVQKMREPFEALQNAGGSGGMPLPQGPGGGVGPPPQMGPPPPAVPQQVPGVAQGPAAPNPDEVRRLLG